MEKASSPSGRGYCKDASDNIMMICFDNAVSLLTRHILTLHMLDPACDADGTSCEPVLVRDCDSAK